MSDFIISSFRGGQVEDSPISIPNDACVEATNVEFVRGAAVERRRGAIEIDLDGSGIEDYDEVVWLYHHHPSPYHTDVQFWVLAFKYSPATLTFVYKDATGWHTPTVLDAPDVNYPYSVVGQTLHGKLFIAYKSDEDRLHVWDGSTIRRTGLAEPIAGPTVAETGSGSFSGIRYYRIRYATLDVDDVVKRRSEPSATTTYDPADFGSNGSGAIVTRPALINEGETHWEIEASVDNANFYRISTILIATTTYTDSYGYNGGYAIRDGAVLSEEIQAYSLIPSGRYLTAIDDRLMIAASFENDELASRVQWSPVLNSDGVGNDERLDLTIDPSVDLENYEGGGITALSTALSGYVFAAKESQTYQLTKSGVRTRAYDVHVITKSRGIIEGSLVTALDNMGNPTLFGLDPDVGPVRFSPRGLEPCGLDIFDTWDDVNLNAEKVVARGVYYQENQQILWFVATADSDVPDRVLVLHTAEMRAEPDGTRRGWAIWEGNIAGALAVCLFHENVNDLEDEEPSGFHKPFIGVVGDGLIWKIDTGFEDNSHSYSARVVSKHYVRANMLHKFGIMNASIFAKAENDAVIDITVKGARPGLGLIEKQVTGISLESVAGEGTWVLRAIDNLSMADLNTVYLIIEDTDPPSNALWTLGQIALREVPGQNS